MSVYYDCVICGATCHCDSEDLIVCDCGSCFCSKNCGQPYNYDENDPKTDDNKVTCVICRHEQHTTYALLEAVLKHFNITEAQAINIWRMEKKKNNEKEATNSTGNS